ncbi:MAG TPA: SCP2 sterol-binding domain-containing protein [Candidatus Binataceae bacterium]|nr:SCP2 sterol-binding domain-containing protein [Candidatus Binataceae bacterium]
MADAPKSCKEAFDQSPSRFNKEAAKGLNAVYQFDLSGDGGGKWYIAISNDQCEVSEGAHPSPNITLSMAAKDYLDMLAGKLNGQMAFMTGKLRIAGDLGLALKLQSLFN